jgi:nucleotide-binding universal stress UspA family protein
MGPEPHPTIEGNMSKVDSIVVAFDFSADATRAVRRAAIIAAEHGAKLRLLHVVRQSMLEPLRDWFGSRARADAAFDRTRASLGELADATAKEYRIDTEPIIRRGNAVDEILRVGEAADLLVVGARGSDPMEDFVRGTLAARLLKKRRRPLLIVKLPAQRPYQRVLVPVDFSDRSPAALRLAMQLASRASIHVLHAYEAAQERRLRHASVSEREIERLRASARSKAHAAMRLLLSPLRDQRHRLKTTVEHGDELLLTLDKQQGIAAELVVLGPRRRTAAAKLLLGSMSREFLLRDPPSDVLVMPEPVSAKESRSSRAGEQRALAS